MLSGNHLILNIVINCNFYHKVLILVKSKSFLNQSNNLAGFFAKKCIFKRILLLFSTFEQKSTNVLKF